MKRVAVEQLTLNVEADHLSEVFGSFGPVSRASVAYDETTGLSKGFGFVEFFDASDAATSLIFMNGAVIDGNTIRASFIGDSEEVENS